MREKIKTVLVKEGYTQAEIQASLDALCNLQHPNLRTALLQYVESGGSIRPEIWEGTFSTTGLMTKFDFKYPATLIYMDWYYENPQEALATLCWLDKELL